MSKEPRRSLNEIIGDSPWTQFAVSCCLLMITVLAVAAWASSGPTDEDSERRMNLILAVMQQKAAVEVNKVAALQGQAAIRAQDAATKVEQVKRTLAIATAANETALQGIASTSEKTHTLVNSQRGDTLRALATALRIIATDRPTPENAAAAAAAERAVAMHEGRQATVDSAGGSPS